MQKEIIAHALTGSSSTLTGISPQKASLPEASAIFPLFVVLLLVLIGPKLRKKLLGS